MVVILRGSSASRDWRKQDILRLMEAQVEASAAPSHTLFPGCEVAFAMVSIPTGSICFSPSTEKHHSESLSIHSS